MMSKKFYQKALIAVYIAVTCFGASPVFRLDSIALARSERTTRLAAEGQEGKGKESERLRVGRLRLGEGGTETHG